MTASYLQRSFHRKLRSSLSRRFSSRQYLPTWADSKIEIAVLRFMPDENYLRVRSRSKFFLLMMLDAFNNLALHFEILFLCSKEDTIFSVIYFLLRILSRLYSRSFKSKLEKRFFERLLCRHNFWKKALAVTLPIRKHFQGALITSPVNKKIACFGKAIS